MRRWRIVGLSMTGLLTLAGILVWGDSTDMRPPVLSEVERKAPAVASTPLLTAPDLPEVAKKRVAPPPGLQLTPPDLPPIGPREMIRPGEAPLTLPQLTDIERRSLQPPQVAFLEQPQLPEVGWPEVREFKDFKGGLDLSTYKTKVPPDRAVVLENARWNEQGEMYKRPGYSEHSTPPFIPNFLYSYYQQDGDKFTMGGSDTALYFWHEDSSGDGWTHLASTGGTSGRWDGATFEDYFIGTHFGVKPVIWDGDSIYTSLTLEARDSFYVEWSDIVKDTMYTDCGRFQTVFTLTSPPASFTVNQLVGYTFEWYKNIGGSEVQRMLILSNTESTINATLPCSLELVPDKPERWCWVKPWFHSVDVDSGTSDSVTVCYDDPDFCCFRPGDEAPSVRLWDSDLDTLKLKRDWTQILAVTDSRGNVFRNYIGNHMAFGVKIDAGSPPDTNTYVTINGWMVACFNEASHYEIYTLSSALDDEGIKFVETFDSRLWFAWTGVNAIDSIVVYEHGDSAVAGEDTSVASIETTVVSVDSTCACDSCGVSSRWVYLQDADGCGRCSTMITCDPACGWPNRVAWEDSVAYVPVEVYSDTSYSVHDTVMKYLLVESIAPGSLWVVFNSNYGTEGFPVPGRYLTLFTMDTTGNLWREGTIDSASTVGEGWSSLSEARLWDDDFSWDSTASYESYLFTVHAGTGAGIKTFLHRWNPLIAGAPGYRWSDSSFFVPNFGAGCFDNTTQYQIHSIDTTSIKSCYVETTFSYDTTFTYTILWEYFDTYDTNYTDQQNKNKIIYSEISELGGLTIWLPEHHIYLTPGDGDYITGMISLSDARHVDVPTHLLMVTKNASSYKIVPTSTAGVYDFWYISTQVGCVSNSAMAVAEGVVLFPDQSGVWAWDQRSRPQCISLLIDPIFEAWDIENLEATSAIYNPQDRHYYISLPVDIDTVINGEFTTTFYRDSAGADNQFIHLITTLGGEQGNDIEITEDTTSSYCDIASDTLGNYCVLVKNQSNLFLMRFDSLNVRVGATIKINDVDNKVTPAECHVDMNNNGRIVVVWEDFRDSSWPGGTYDIYGQYLRFADGKVGNNFHVNSNYAINDGTGSVQASVAINDDSVCIFVWKDWSDADFQTCIFATIDTFSATDTIMNDYFKPWGGHCYTPGCDLTQTCASPTCVNNWLHPDIDAGDTTFVIVCIDDPMEAYGRYIVMNYDLDTLLSALVGQVEMNGSQWPSVSMNKKGKFVATWMQLKGAGSDFKVWARKYDVGGVASGSYFRVDNTSSGMWTEYPAVALNEQDQFCIVWWDERCGDADYYRCYTWDGGAVSAEALLNDICNLSGYYFPEITATNTWLEIDTTKYTLAWNIDYHGWSEETFSFSAIEYQHGLTDPVKVIFADPDEAKVYNYGTQADDVNDAVILTYQSPYLSFVQNPSWDVVMSYATLEAFLGTGSIYVYWYKDYSELVHVDTISCGGDCREEIQLPDNLSGKNISMKIVTGAEIDDFTLSGYWWEYLINRWRN